MPMDSGVRNLNKVWPGCLVSLLHDAGTSAGCAGPAEAGGSTLKITASHSCLTPLGRDSWKAGLSWGCRSECLHVTSPAWWPQVVDFLHGGSVFQQMAFYDIILEIIWYHMGH